MNSAHLIIKNSPINPGPHLISAYLQIRPGTHNSTWTRPGSAPYLFLSVDTPFFISNFCSALIDSLSLLIISAGVFTPANFDAAPVPVRRRLLCGFSLFISFFFFPSPLLLSSSPRCQHRGFSTDVRILSPWLFPRDSPPPLELRSGGRRGWRLAAAAVLSTSLFSDGNAVDDFLPFSLYLFIFICFILLNCKV